MSFFEKRNPRRPQLVPLPYGLYEAFRKVAEKTNDSVKDVVVRALREWLAEHHPEIRIGR